MTETVFVGFGILDENGVRAQVHVDPPPSTLVVVALGNVDAAASPLTGEDARALGEALIQAADEVDSRSAA